VLELVDDRRRRRSRHRPSSEPDASNHGRGRWRTRGEGDSLPRRAWKQQLLQLQGHSPHQGLDRFLLTFLLYFTRLVLGIFN
jgi:hypothetical protein